MCLFQASNFRLEKQMELLNQENIHLKKASQEKDENLTELRTKFETKIEDYEILSTKHANLLVSKKELEDELKAKINTLEVSDELSKMSEELKKLHQILAEKEKELVTAKLQETNLEKVEELKSQVISKETKIHEVELTMEIERKKIQAYEEHILHLKGQLKDLQNQTSQQLQNRSSFLDKIKNEYEDVQTQLIKDLKSQLKTEQEKLGKAVEKVTTLESDRLTYELELNTLKKTLTLSNEELKEMTSKCHNLQDELMKQKAQNQFVPKKDNSVQQIQALEISLASSQSRIAHFEEKLEQKDQVIFDICSCKILVRIALHLTVFVDSQ